jgi:4-hydroxy-tetrahydrodipicolinate synthase
MKTMSANSFKGVITALITPFKNGAIDVSSFKRLIKYQLDQGIHGFVINGTTAESPTLTKKEVKDLFDIAKSEVAGQVPLIVGTGTNSTAATAELTREVGGWGADGVLVVVPYYNKPPQRGLVEHFKTVAQSSSLPVFLYNVPGRTITTLEPETIGEIAKTKNVIGIKEATGNMELLEKIKAQVNPNFILLSGDDGTFVDFCARGGHGTIAVASHFIGKDMIAFMERAHGGDKKAVSEYTEKYTELMKWLYIEANPIPVKMVMHWLGVIETQEIRLPLVPLDEKFHKDFKACLKKLNLL